MFTIGPKTKPGMRSLLTEASKDDPIYKRGFAVGEINLSNFSPNTEIEASPQSNNQSPQAKFVEQLKQRGLKVNEFSRDDLKRKRSPDPMPGEWPKER